MDATLEILETLGKLAVGESVAIPGRGGWEIMLIKRGGGFDLVHRNPAGEDQYKFFAYTTESSPYGAGMIVQEPSLGVPLAAAGIHIDIVGDELAGRIVGAIVLDSEGKVTGRFSWSNVVFARKQTFSISPDGELTVNGVSQGYVHALFLPDKNRLEGYVGVFKPVKPTEAVKVLEMETLLFASS